jgi:transposase-like protein
MEDYPKTLAEFEARFSSDDACREYLLQLRWPGGVVCPRCGGSKVWERSRDLLMCATCTYEISVTAGTLFERTRKPLSMWFRAMWWVTSQKTGASALGLQRILGLGSYLTAWTWLHKLRRAMVRPGRDRLSGVVQVDETYVGGTKPGKRGRGATGKSLVLIAAELDDTRIGRIRLKRVPNSSGQSLEEAIQQAVFPDSVIQTDGWTGYTRLGSLGYTHEVVRSAAPVGEDMLPCCHRVASLLKRWMMGTHQGAISHEHLEYYLDEFTFRFNRRTSQHRGKLFYRLAQQAVAIEPTSYKEMVKQVRGRKHQRHNA